VKEVVANEMGHIVIKLPLPPGTLQTLYKNDDRYLAGYLRKYNGYYLTGDAGYKDQNGNIFVMSRTDDIINVAAHRLSTSAMEEVLHNHPDVAESTVIGALDVIKGQTPIGFIVLKSDSITPIEQIKLECIALVRKKVFSLFIDLKDWSFGGL
jgi:propionyl-CoA synthetase